MDDALDHVFGDVLSLEMTPDEMTPLDMTPRDLRGETRKLGRPWEMGKAFERTAPVGPIHRVEAVGICRRAR